MSASQSPTPRRRALFLTAALGFAALVFPAFTGCSTPAPVIPQGAWAISFIQPAADCQIANHNMSIGDITPQKRTKLFEDGATVDIDGTSSVADVSCTVIANGSTFEVSGYASAAERFLSISVPELAKDATVDKPSKGIVSYQSPKTANSFSQSDCDFYFEPSTQQGISEGQVFVTFVCKAIAAAADNICQIDPGYAAFEKCSIAAE